MIRFGNRPIDISPLIKCAETATLVTRSLMIGTDTEPQPDSPLAVEKLDWDSPLYNEIYSQLTLFGKSILGSAGMVIAFGERAVAKDGPGFREISGNPLATTGRFIRISSVFIDEPVIVGSDYSTNIVPAMEFEVTSIPLESTSVKGSDGTIVKFPRVSYPLLGQVPQVYEYVQAFTAK